MSDIITVDFTGERPALESKRSGSYCRHAQVVVDDATRSVKCKACGRPLDAWRVLWREATNQTNLFGRLQDLKARIARATDELTEINRQLRNAKARLKRAKERT